MKILVFPSWYPSKENMVSGSFFKEQAELLAQDHDVAVVIVRLVPMKNILSNGIITVTENTVNNVKTIEYYVPSFGLTRLFHGYEWWAWWTKIALRNYVNRYGKPDVIHTHSFMWAGYVIAKQRCKYSIPIVYTEHLSKVNDNRLSNFEQEKLLFTINNSDRVLAVSDKLSLSMKSFGGINKKIEIVPNMVSNAFHVDRGFFRNKPFVFCSVSNLVRIKRVDLLILGFYYAFRNKDGIQLLIVGDGPEREKLQNLIKELRIEKKVKIYGRATREEVVNIMQHSDAFIMVSESETFGLVYVEAMACGLPTIGTLNGGSNSILDNYGAYSVPINNVEKIVESLQYVYNNIENYNRDRISENILKQYSGDAVKIRLDEIYESVIRLDS